jgi:hypothetical protein
MTHRDPDGFVDLLVDTPVNGRLYMCASCVEQAGRRVGMLPKANAQTLTDRLADAANTVRDLEQQLDVEKRNKLVSLDDVKTLVGVRGPGRPRKEDTAPEAA